ncbi:MAG TPA: GDP-mannose 4,6-dehydratase [Candidatus Acidoferrales bacterium]|nr:GDP-mannose 4,6-dehydratase [Candidatus Acidoferrales bacterium]
MKKALITGITGQDGAYLSKLLIEKNYAVYGAYRRASDVKFDRLRFLGIEDKIEYVPMELLEFTNIYRTIEKIQPDELYNLGAQSSVPASFEEPIFTAEVTGIGALRILEAVRAINPKIKVYQASSSEMFGKVRERRQKEDTPFHPRSPYALSKAFAHHAAVNYRESYGLFVCSGILFNHESPLRGAEFVTRKITQSVARFKLGRQKEVRLGNLDSSRDWGYAPEYVEAMWMMLQQPEPDDYVIATGETHTVREFAQVAFAKVGIELEWSGLGLDERGINKADGAAVVSVDPQFFRPADADYLVGDCSKARRKLGWTPKTSFETLVGIMVEHDLSFAANGMRSW